jgi:hypothetical protein
MPDGPPDRRRFATCVSLHAGRPEGFALVVRALARCQTAALFFVATRWQIVANESPRKTTNFVLHAGRPVSLACRTARDAGSL